MRKLLIASLVFAVAGCKGKPAHREPPKNAVAATGSASGSDGKRAAPDLALPSGPGTPPLKTTRKLARADFEKLQALEFPGFDKTPHGLNDVVMETRYITKDHPRLWAVVTIEPCNNDCWPMDLDEWKKHEADLKKHWLGPLADAPDIDWEMGKTEIHGQPLIYTYQLGQAPTPGEEGGASFTDTYILNYNDGINKMTVVGRYADDQTKNKETMAKLAPKSDLQLLAVSFFDYFSHAWPTS